MRINKSTFFVMSFLIIALTMFINPLKINAATCDWFVGGCKGIPLENPGQNWLGTEASCLATRCSNRTTCMSGPPGAPWGCYYTAF